jgi:hypothetical protein
MACLLWMQNLLSCVSLLLTTRNHTSLFLFSFSTSLKKKKVFMSTCLQLFINFLLAFKKFKN